MRAVSSIHRRTNLFSLWLAAAAALTAASAASFTAAYYERREPKLIERMLNEASQDTSFILVDEYEPNIAPWLIAGTVVAILALVAYVLAARRASQTRSGAI